MEKSSSSSERRKQILELASQHTEVKVEQLQSLFGVSEVTIRRDLDVLESNGEIRRIRGGATFNKLPQLEVKFKEKLKQSIMEKKEIAKAAASLVKDNQVVMLSGGTTTMYIARELVHKRSITVVTPAINIAGELAGHESINLVMIGGIVRRETYVASGHLADDALSSMYADIAFVGVDGVDIATGFTTPSLIEGRTDKIMLQAATKSVIVADHTKFRRVAFAPIASLAEVSLLITDNRAPELYLQELQSALCNVARAMDLKTTES